MYCKFCNEYLGIFNLNYFCEFCSNLRRVLLVYGHKEIDEVLNDNLLGVSINKKTEPKEEKEEKEEIKIEKDQNNNNFKKDTAGNITIKQTIPYDSVIREMKQKQS
jgi:hypothetical protein